MNVIFYRITNLILSGSYNIVMKDGAYLCSRDIADILKHQIYNYLALGSILRHNSEIDPLIVLSGHLKPHRLISQVSHQQSSVFERKHFDNSLVVLLDSLDYHFPLNQGEISKVCSRLFLRKSLFFCFDF